MSETAFGVKAINNGNLLSNLRAGRNLQEATTKKIMRFLKKQGYGFGEPAPACEENLTSTVTVTGGGPLRGLHPHK